MSEGNALFIEKLEAEAEQSVTSDKVLAVLDGDKAAVKTPTKDKAANGFVCGFFVKMKITGYVNVNMKLQGNTEEILWFFGGGK